MDIVYVPGTSFCMVYVQLIHVPSTSSDAAGLSGHTDSPETATRIDFIITVNDCPY